MSAIGARFVTWSFCVSTWIAVATTATSKDLLRSQLLGQNGATLNSCRPLTLTSGEHSGWGSNDPDLAGEDLVIRDQQSFARFWEQHTGLVTPPSDQPHIDFRRLVVIAAIQGPQTSGGGPSITISRVWRIRPNATRASVRPGVVVTIVDDERPGPLDVITNPYHIVLVPKWCVPPGAHVRFQHIPPRRGTNVIRGTVWVGADAVDWRGLPWGRVQLRSEDGERRMIRTGWDGSYRFLNLRPGVYEVDASNPPYIADPQTVELDADQIYHLDFYLEAGPP